MAGTTEAKLLNQMIRHHLARPDAISWLAAADLLEEQGQAADAAKWRRRGEWFDLLVTRFYRAAGGKDTAAHVGDFVVYFTKKKTTVLVGVMRISSGKWIDGGVKKSNLWMLNVKNLVRKTRERVLLLIDGLAGIS